MFYFNKIADFKSKRWISLDNSPICSLSYIH